MSYKTNTNHHADIAEQAFKMFAIRCGWIVNTPSSRDSDYDFVVDINGSFERVQVKNITTKNVLPRIVDRKNQRTTKNGKVRNSVDYAERGIEWLVGVNFDSDEIYCYHIDTYRYKPKKFKVTARDGRRHPPDTFPTNPNIRKNNE